MRKQRTGVSEEEKTFFQYCLVKNKTREIVKCVYAKRSLPQQQQQQPAERRGSVLCQTTRGITASSTLQFVGNRP